MNKQEFREWIYNNFNIPADNCTLAPDMLDGILDYAGTMEAERRYYFLCTVFPGLPESVIRTAEW